MKKRKICFAAMTTIILGANLAFANIEPSNTEAEEFLASSLTDDDTETVILLDDDGNIYHETIEVNNPVTSDTDIRYTSDDVILRQAASIDSDVISLIVANSSIELISNDGSWSKIISNGQEGYIQSEYLRYEPIIKNIQMNPNIMVVGDVVDDTELTAKEDTSVADTSIINEPRYTTASTNIYLSASDDSEILKNVTENTKVTLLNVDNDWADVLINGQKGYIQCQYLRYDPISYEPLMYAEGIQEIAEEIPLGQVIAPTEDAEETVEIRYTNDNVNLRQGAGTNTDIISTLDSNTAVNLLDIDDMWANVEVNGQSGYIRSDLLRYEPIVTFDTANIETTMADIPEIEAVEDSEVEYTEEDSTEVRYTGANVNLREGPSTETNAQCVVPENSKVTLLENDGTWSQVEVDGDVGYIRNDLLTLRASDFIQVTLDNVNLRTDATTECDIITTVPENTTVEVIEASSEWNKVKYGEKEGYISNDYLDLATDKEVSYNSSNNYSNVEYATWSQIKENFTIGEDAKVTDLYTGKVYYVRSFSNGSHADVEPVTKEDTSIMYDTFGNNWSWDIRPVEVTINGHSYGGSINGMPHGGGINSNNGMNGQVCIHFIGSTTHNGNSSYTTEHQAYAEEAYELMN